MLRNLLVLLFVLLSLMARAQADDAPISPTDELIPLGFIENVAIGKLGLKMKAKLDTGADTSSVHAYDVDVYDHPTKKRMVRFKLKGKNGRNVRYNLKVRRFVNIKTKTGGYLRRPVVVLPLCLGGVWGKAEINLADRGDFLYDILVGREYLANRVLVDSGRTFISKQPCDRPD